MITWAQISYGAVLSGLVAAIAVGLLARTGRWAMATSAAIATAGGAAAWNAILHAAHGAQFFTDAPVAVLPASWQDTGSGVFALATTSVVFGLITAPAAPARHVTGYAMVCALAAFLVDVYLY
jgi:hypothetical protein